MTLKVWHLLAVGAVALTSLTALSTFLLAGHHGGGRTQTVAIVPIDLSGEQAQRAALANVRSAVPSIEAYYADNGSYAGATISTLRDYDSTIDDTVDVGFAETENYCLESTVDGQTARFMSGDRTPEEGRC